MKKYIVISVFFLSMMMVSQEKVSFNHLKVIAGWQPNVEWFGIGMKGTVAYKKHIMGLRIYKAEDITLFDVVGKRFLEFDVLYGREFQATHSLFFETYTGLALINGDTFGVPIDINMLLFMGKHFGLGLNAHYSLNSLENLSSYNLMLVFR